MPEQLKMYCPKCGKAARGSSVMFERRLECPGCGKTVRFQDSAPDLDAPTAADAIAGSAKAAGNAIVAGAVAIGNAMERDTMRVYGTDDKDVVELLKSTDWLTVFSGVCGLALVLLGFVLMASGLVVWLLFGGSPVEIVLGIALGVVSACAGMATYATRRFFMAYMKLRGRMILAIERIADRSSETGTDL